MSPEPTAVADIAAAEPPPQRDPLATLAAMLRSGATSTGQRARLRRADPQRGSQDALLEAELLFARAGLSPRDEQHRRWFLVLHCLALVEGRHVPTTEAGAALARLGFSESRLRQLVEADADTLFELLPRIARRVAAAGASMNWWPLAELILTADSAEPEHIARADRARQRIVQHYLRAAPAPESKTQGDPAP